MRDVGLDLIGREIGAYRILSLLGAGGMGEVYRARDTKLGRDVAIKILPSVFTSDAERRARFEREARVLATLNHPRRPDARAGRRRPPFALRLERADDGSGKRGQTASCQ